ncbi:MAG: trypsin-like peptidase domain-containing protein [Patescibacteria group bacterium]|jgi:serine protease Do
MTTTTKQTILTIIISLVSSILVSGLLIGGLVSAMLLKPDLVASLLNKSGKTSVTEQTTNNNTTNLSNLASQQEAIVVDVVKKTNPAVVSIIATQDVPKFEPLLERNYRSPLQDLFGIDPFFGQQYDTKDDTQTPNTNNNTNTEQQEIGGGSGFIVSADGYIVTNKHVVDIASDADFTVYTSDKQKYPAKVVARDPSNDIAVLKIETTNLPFLTFGNSEQLQVGQSVIAIGNPLLEFNNSVSVGVISGLARSIEAGDSMGQTTEQLENVIQTDAAINQGNSGGPLLNLKGEVIGMNSAVAGSQTAQNIGFALPANLISSVVDSVKTTGTIERPYLGVRYLEINDSVQEKNQLSVNYGVLVTSSANDELAVIPGSPADKAGIQTNDIILEIDGKKLDENTSLSSYISQKNISDKVTLKILHKGEEKDIEVTLEKRP